MDKEIAFKILESSINSAIFIDEKAREPFVNGSLDIDNPDEKLSIDLFKSFKEKGKNLAVHKFEIDNLENHLVLDYLFKGRDLILLDWELAEIHGEEYSLKLLNKALQTPHVSFCCIYSRCNNFNQISLFLEVYFSGFSKKDFDDLKNNYNYIEIKTIKAFLDNDNNNEIEINNFLKEQYINVKNLPNNKMKKKGHLLILRYIYAALSNNYNYLKTETSGNEYQIINNTPNSFVINNTFVLTLKKEDNEDSDCYKLLHRISNVIINNERSFFHLLGLEMQSIFNSNENFIGDGILNSSTETLFKLRKYIDDDKVFGEIIKKLLLEQMTLNLRTAKLKLLDKEFLDFNNTKLNNKEPTEDDLFQFDVFYNTVKVKGFNKNDELILNFGDVFISPEKKYYLCVTALCDCYYPNKIKNNFYFVIGNEFKDKQLALKLNDTAFLSFLSNDKAVYWGDTEYLKLKKTNGNDIAKNIENYKDNESTLKSLLYKPFYVKPQIFNVKSNLIIDEKIEICNITNNNNGQPNQNINFYDLTYITTLRTEYTQRIANHAFGYPIRVGVDFVKKGF